MTDLTATCPITKGPHVLTLPPWGVSCRRCHKTWSWIGGRRAPTWPNIAELAE